MKKNKITLITEMALFVSIGFILDFIQGTISNFLPFFPNGGSIGIAMIATLIFSYRHGLYGLLCGLLTGFLTMLSGVWISPFANNPLHVFLQLGLDYFFSYFVIGLAGCFAYLISKKQGKTKLILLIVTSISSGLLKYLSHFLAGMIYWPNEDATSQFIYSLTYNGSYMIPSIILTTLLLVLIYFKAPSILEYKETHEEVSLINNSKLSLSVLVVSIIGFISSLYFYIESFIIYDDLIASYGEVFSASEVMLFFLIIFILLIIISLTSYLKNRKTK